MTEKKGPIHFKIPAQQDDPAAAAAKAADLNSEFVKTLHAALTKDGDTVEVTGKIEGP